MKVIPEMCCEQ